MNARRPGRVVVVGSINMDVVAFAPRHPRVGETIMGDRLALLPGGKGANQAVAAGRGGADTALVGRVGGDAFAEQLTRFLRDEGLDLSLTIALRDESTGTAVIEVAEDDNTIVVIAGANARLDEAALDGAAFATGDVVVAQFETPQATTRAAFERARRAGATTILNPAPAAEMVDGLLELCDIVVLNETELALLAGGGAEAGAIDAETAGEHAARLRVRDDQTIVVTLGAAGAAVCAPDGTFHVAGRQVDVVDTTGAGDCFVGNLAAALAAGTPVRAAVDRAVRASALCVQTAGAAVSMPTRAEVDALA